MKKERQVQGFTLIEVLLVVAILGILAAVVVVSVGGRREEAMVHATRATIANVCAGIDLYEVDTGKYPDSLQALISPDGSQNWRGPYLRTPGGALPQDAWGRNLGYSRESGARRYVVTSLGADGSAGGGDDLTN
ncbi:MAG: type II secretion system protein GspG [Lentisphaerae bacterium]|nr:type II secretion system protein GspG [Lentisphaerota bacterium]